MKDSAIEWCDHTFNPWIGCTKVSAGCTNCYAETRDRRHLIEKVDHWGKGAPRLRTSASMWKQPLKWNRTAICRECSDSELIGSDDCRHCGRPFGEDFRRRPRVFCASLADWLDDEVRIEWLADLLTLIHATPNLDWLLLTKRPQHWSDRLHAAFRQDSSGDLDFVSAWLDGDAPPNIWIGTSVENQACADERIPKLLEIPAVVRFLSCEPLLGDIDLIEWVGHPIYSGVAHHHRTNHGGGGDGQYYSCEECDFVVDAQNGKINPVFHWVIVGGESGPNARPMHPDWARSLRDQCAAASVPFFFKQWGEWASEVSQGVEVVMDDLAPNQAVGWGDGKTNHVLYTRVGKKRAGRLLDGVEYSAFPNTSQVIGHTSLYS